MQKQTLKKPRINIKRYLIVVIMTLISIINITTKVQASTQKASSGVNLDIARSYYSVNSIKQIINIIHQNNGNTLQLHLTDNQNYGVQSDYLNQKPNQKSTNNIVINPKTKRPYLTYQQLNDLIQYAQSKNVNVIPEIDIPAHSQALISLLKSKVSKSTYHKIITSKSELKYQNKTAQSIMLKVLNDFSKHLPSDTIISISGDEMTVNTKNDEQKFINLIQKANTLVNNNQQTLQIYNDGIGKYNLKQLPTNVQIVYWSLSGDTDNKTDANYNLKTRSTPDQIINHGNPIINANSNYFYLNNQVDPNDLSEIDQFNHQLQKFQFNLWNSKPAKADSINRTILSIWGNETHFDITNDNTILNRLKPYLNAYFYQIQTKLK